MLGSRAHGILADEYKSMSAEDQLDPKKALEFHRTIMPKDMEKFISRLDILTPEERSELMMLMLFNITGQVNILTAAMNQLGDLLNLPMRS